MAVATQQQEREEVGARRVVFLLDACSGIEQRILRQWILEHHVPTGIPYEMIPIPPTRRRPRRPRLDSRLDACLAAYDDPLLTPLRRTSGPTGKKFMLMPPAVWFGGWPFSCSAYCRTRWSRFDLCDGRNTTG